MALAYDELNATNDDFNITGVIGDFLNDTEFSYTDMFAEELAYILHVYLTPILIIVGVIGNLLSIIVFYKSKLRGQSTSQYLSALAVSDTIFLLQLIPPWLKAVKASLVFVRSGFCQLFVYLTYVSSANSSWLVVAFTVERFVAVIYPLRSRSCTVRRARVCIACVGASCVALNTPVLWFAQARGADCDIDRALMEHAARFNVLDTVLSFTLPLAFTTVLNVWIMVGVCRGSRARRRLTRDARANPPRARLSRPRVARRTRSQLQRSQQRVTRMLLLVSSVFVLLNLPAYSMRIVAYAMNMSSYEYSGRWAALQQICQLFFNANFGINFFLYCLSGQNFRRALLYTHPCVGRAANMLRKLCCCCEDSPPSPPSPPPPRASVTSAATIHTEPRSGAAVISMDEEERDGEATYYSTTTNEHTVDGKPYLRHWQFGSLRQKREFQEFQSYFYHLSSMHSFPLPAPTTRLTPVLELPDTMNDSDETDPERESYDFPMFSSQNSFDLSSGENSPFDAASVPCAHVHVSTPWPSFISMEGSDASADEENSDKTPVARACYFAPEIIQDDREFPFTLPVYKGKGRIATVLYKDARGFPMQSNANPLRASAGRLPLFPRAARAAAQPGRRTM